jgi:hypothetical protein
VQLTIYRGLTCGAQSLPRALLASAGKLEI